MGKYKFYAALCASFVVFLTFAALVMPDAGLCDEVANHKAIKNNQIAKANQQVMDKQLKCNSWTFGKSMSRDEAIWKKGVAAKDVQARATGKKGISLQNPVDGKGKDTEKSGNRSFPGGLVMESHKSTWKVNPEEPFMRPDEEIPREGRHVVKAFADVAPSENLDINIGPELIIKDENYGDQIANSSQPDSILGLGMNFKLDF